MIHGGRMRVNALLVVAALEWLCLMVMSSYCLTVSVLPGDH